MPDKVLTILVLDGSNGGHATTACLDKGIIARIVRATDLNSVAQAARSAIPDIAILGSDHSEVERDTAERLLCEMNPKIQIVRM